MTIKEAILKSMEDTGGIVNYLSIYKDIASKNYYDFGPAKTPASTISALLGEFIRKGDVRVRRIKDKSGSYSYYLTKNEEKLAIDLLYSEEELSPKFAVNSEIMEKSKSYVERDLHILLTSFLKNQGIYSKTIFHEQSNGKDARQIWTHPDIVAIEFLKLHSRAGQNLLKTIDPSGSFKISSYELKREIFNDNDLKKAFFQAVSNSSWSNYGYLVALEFSVNLTQEMERLNQAFGIGIIELNSNPFESKILFQSKYRTIDFKMVDKLCKINTEFERFIEQIDKLMMAEDKYVSSTEKELIEFCDKFLKTEAEIDEYRKLKFLPSKE